MRIGGVHTYFRGRGVHSLARVFLVRRWMRREGGRGFASRWFQTIKFRERRIVKRCNTHNIFHYPQVSRLFLAQALKHDRVLKLEWLLKKKNRSSRSSNRSIKHQSVRQSIIHHFTNQSFVCHFLDRSFILFTNLLSFCQSILHILYIDLSFIHHSIAHSSFYLTIILLPIKSINYLFVYAPDSAFQCLPKHSNALLRLPRETEPPATRWLKRRVHASVLGSTWWKARTAHARYIPQQYERPVRCSRAFRGRMIPGDGSA